MKNKLEQINQSYRKALGQILLREFPDVVDLVVTDVLIDPSYHHGRAWLRASEAVFTEVEKRRGDIQLQLTKYVKTRYTPKMTFVRDEGELDKIDELFTSISQ